MSNWISVEDELPKIRDDFYIWPPVNLEEEHYTAYFNNNYKDKWTITFHIGNGFTDDYHPSPTHWRPIEPPKGE